MQLVSGRPSFIAVAQLLLSQPMNFSAHPHFHHDNYVCAPLTQYDFEINISLSHMWYLHVPCNRIKLPVF